MENVPSLLRILAIYSTYDRRYRSTVNLVDRGRYFPSGFLAARYVDFNSMARRITGQAGSGCPVASNGMQWIHNRLYGLFCEGRDDWMFRSNFKEAVSDIVGLALNNGRS